MRRQDLLCGSVALVALLGAWSPASAAEERERAAAEPAREAPAPETSPAIAARAAEAAASEEPLVPTWEVTAEEAGSARTVADAHLKRTRPEEILYFVGAELYRDKAARSRQVRVTHYRPEGDLTVYSVVDLRSGEVIAGESLAHVPTSLSEEEFAAARAIVLADPGVKAALGANAASAVVEPMIMRTLSPADPYFGHRVIRMLFRRGSDYLAEPIAVVDLTTKKVTIELEAPKGVKQ